MSSPRSRQQLRSLAPLVFVVAVAGGLFVAASLLLVAVAGEDIEDPFRDIYELTGSRLSGLVSTVGVMLFVSTAAICLFASRLASAHSAVSRPSRFLLAAAILTAVLAADDYLSIHEFPGELLPFDEVAGRIIQNAFEAAILGTWGVLLTILLWRFRSEVAASEWILLALAAVLLLGSVALDLAPQAWLMERTGISVLAQSVIEDTAKLIGITFYAAYFIRVSAWVLRWADA